MGIVAAVDGIEVNQTADSTTVTPGDTIQFETTVDVDGGDDGQIDAASIGLQTTLPTGWTVENRDPGEEFVAGPDGWLWFGGPSGVDGADTVMYTVKIPADAAPGDYTASITAQTEDGESTSEGTTITVQQESEPADPADFQVVDGSLSAPGSATQGDSIDVSAEVTNTGDETETKTVEFRLDVDGDGFDADDDVVLSQDVEIAGDESTTVSFEAVDTSELAPSTYTHGVVTEDDSATAQITIEAVEEPADDAVSVSLEPTDATVGVGGETTFDVVVGDLDGEGVGAFDVTIESDDANVVGIESGELTGPQQGSGFSEITVADDGSSVQIQAFAQDTDDSGEATIATVTVAGVDDGTADLTVDATAVGDESGANYAVSSESGATVTVEPVTVSVTNLDAPPAAAPGQTVTVTAQVNNDGNQDVTRTVKFQLDSGDDGFDTNDVVATKEVEVDAGASVSVTLEATLPADLALGEYQHRVIADTGQPATIRIAPPKPNQDFEGYPADLDDDGDYEDVNGDGTVNEVDSQALFANLESSATQDYSAQYDYNGNGVLDEVDVQFHFNNEVQSENSANSFGGPAQLIGMIVELLTGWL
jgi:hypothetical protein